MYSQYKFTFVKQRGAAAIADSTALGAAATVKAVERHNSRQRLALLRPSKRQGAAIVDSALCCCGPCSGMPL